MTRLVAQNNIINNHGMYNCMRFKLVNIKGGQQIKYTDIQHEFGNFDL